MAAGRRSELACPAHLSGRVHRCGRCRSVARARRGGDRGGQSRPYYDVRLKEARLARLAGRPGFRFLLADVADRKAMLSLVAHGVEIELIVHLAAQAGVRHSLADPYAYVRSNVMGQLV